MKTYVKKLLIYNHIEQINKILYDKGYSHRIKCYENGNRIQFWLSDITAGDYHTREYGNLTYDKAMIFSESFYNGLNLGTLSNPI